MKKRLIISLSLLTMLIAFIWVMSEKSVSYSEPQEALFAIDNDLLLIPGYKLNGKALFFFIKNGNGLGTAYVKKSFFGWKAGALTWSPMDSDREYEKLNGSRGHGENLMYGLIRHGDERLVQINEERATILDLAMLPTKEIEKFRLEGLYIWYLESEQPLDGGEIKLLEKDTNREIDTNDFKK